MASKSFTEAFNNLSSEKIKDRTQGLEDVRIFLTIPRNIAWINSERRYWLKLLQAIFQIVVDEQRNHAKKAAGTASPALKRLKDGAQVVRLIIERCTADLPRKAFKAVFSHLVSIIVLKGQLFEPISLEYLKALRTLISYRPHLDHLETQQWTHAVALCFAAALGDPIKNQDIVEDAMMQDDDDTEMTQTAGSTNGRSKKRKAAGPLRMTPVDEDGYRSGSPSGFRSAGQDVIELMACIDAFFKSPASPFLACGEALLAKFIRFFRIFPSETSAHLPALTALNRLVQELYYNAKTALEKSSVILWPFLLSLWHTKNAIVKEQLVILLNRLLPFLLYRSDATHTQLVQDLYNHILAEPENRWRSEDLDIDNLELGEGLEQGQSRAFSISLFRLSHGVTSAHALSWATLQLGAFCLSHLQEASQSLRPDLPPTPSSSRSKKRKLDAPIDNLLDSMNSLPEKTILYRLQFLAFYLGYGRNEQKLEVTPLLLKSITPFLTHSNLAIQTWATLVVSSLCSQPLSDKESERAIQYSWSIAVRRLSHPVLGRPAALLMQIFLRNQSTNSVLVMQDLETLSKDIELQGPTFPSDTVCDFLGTLLGLASSDAKLFHLNIRTKIAARFASEWPLIQIGSQSSRAFSAKPRSDPLSVAHFVRLLSRIATLPQAPVQQECLLPDCPMSIYAMQDVQEQELQAWYFHAEIAASPRGLRISSPAAATEPSPSQGASQGPENNLAVRLQNILRKVLHTIAAEIEGDDQAYWSTLPADRARRFMNICVSALLFEANLEDQGTIRSDRNFVLAVGVLGKLLLHITNNKWSINEQADLLATLSPLFLVTPKENTRYRAMGAAGPASGIRQEQLVIGPEDQMASQPTSTPSMISTLWAFDAFRKGFTECKEIFRQLLSVDNGVSDIGPALGEDEFGAIKTTTSTQMTGRAMFSGDNDLATEACLDISIRALLTLQYYEEGGLNAVRMREVVRDLLEGTGTHLSIVGRHVLCAAQSGYLALSSSEMDAFLERIGGELLPSYEYARADEVHMLVLQFLRTTVHIWGIKQDIELGFVENARRLSAWFTAQLRTENIPSYSTRIEFIILLQSFLAPKLSQEAWGSDQEDMACQDGSPISPTAVLIGMLSDVDFRVRFKLSAAMGRLCTYLHEAKALDYTTWQSIADATRFDMTPSGYEHNATLLLTYGNIMVASDFYRPNAYKPIVYYVAMLNSDTATKFIRNLLQAVARQLGLRDITELYTFLACYTMVEHIMDKTERIQIPDPQAFGFASKRELYEAGFTEVGALVLAGPRPEFFEKMCTYAGLSMKVGLQQCLSCYIAYKLTIPRSFKVTEDQRRLEEDNMLAKVTMVANDVGIPVLNVFHGLQDVVVAKIFSFIWEGTYDVKAFQMAFSEDWAASLEVMTGFLADLGDPFQPNVLCPPDIPLADVLGALRSDHAATKGVLDREATLYSVLHHLFAWIAQPPFVTQQLRLLYNTAICIACCYSVISSFQSLLVLILKRCTLLLVQPDLVPLSANIYRWAVGHLVKRIQLDSSAYEDAGHVFAATAEVLLRMSSEGRGHSQLASQRLLDDLENTIIQAAQGRSQTLVTIATTAVSLWPRSLPIQLGIGRMLTSLESARGGIGPVRAIGHIGRHLGKTQVKFPKHRLSQALWQCFSKISPHTLYSDPSATLALAEMLSHTSGELQPRGLGEDTSDSQNLDASSQEIKNNIVLLVQDLLASNTMNMAHIAFQTMRCVLSVSQTNGRLSAESATIAGITTTKLSWTPASPPKALSELLSGDKWLKKSRSRTSWQTDFSLLLIDNLAVKDMFFSQIRTLAQSSSTFAQGCIPSLVLAMLVYAREENRHDIPDILSKYFENILASGAAAVEDIINLAVFLRRYIPPSTKTENTRKLARDEWLRISWHRLAAGAVSVRAYATALLFLELAAEYEKEDGQQNGAAVPFETALPDPTQAQEILYTVYTNISEPDSFYGITPHDLQGGMIRKMQHEGRWTDAMVWHGGFYESQADAETLGAIGIVQSLAASGLPRLSMNMLSSTGTLSAAAALPGSLAYDLAWKTERWDLPSTFTSGHGTADASLFRAVRATQRELDPERLKTTISGCLSREILKLANTITASQSPSNNDVSSLLAIRELHRWVEARDRQPAMDFWRVGDLQELSFDMFDRLATTRLTLLEAQRLKDRRNQISDEPSDLEMAIAKSERDHLLALSRNARSSNHLQKAVNSVIRATNLEDPASPSYAVRFELACVMWAQGEHTVAVDALHRISKDVASGKLNLLPSEEVTLMSYLGDWISKGRLQAPEAIKEKYFDPTVKLLESLSNPDAMPVKADAQHRFAVFADEQYQRMCLQTGEMDRLEAWSLRKEQEVRTMDKRNNSTQSASARRDAQVQSQQDLQAVQSFRQHRKAFLDTALEMFAATLSTADKHNDCIFRLMALWLENSAEPSINQIAQRTLHQIPTYKFIPLIHQLSARLASSLGTGSSQSTLFQEVLADLLHRLCTDHPFHSLFQVYFLRQGAPSGKATVASRRLSAANPELSSQVRRAEAVNDIVQSLRKSPHLRSICQQVETAMAAYIEWANVPPDSIRAMKKKLVIPADQPILKLHNLSIPITTMSLDIDKTCQYDPSKMTCIAKFKTPFTTAGGIHLPKITDCVGTDGKTYTQLYKGGDDVRQDAVMQQIFAVANDVLARDERTKSRSLAVRTYKVIPLTTDAGLLEFVKNSTAIGSWLVPAHEAYNPQDMPIKQAREKLATLQNSVDQRARVRNYEDVARRVHPVMRHFFTEKQYLPSLWFEMRLNYSRSAAVMSMVGYVLGLGDRHVSNIMIDTTKGELVPIDFGIMFEAGKTLPTPEKVPFRLTRDIVDGFGMNGVEGVFRKCSEETMRVLRSQSSVLMTILEVFKFDPLQKWTASAQKVKRAQGSEALERGRSDGESELLTDADRAIATVAAKLNSDLSVEYQVNDLILQATDVNNLGTIFHGWQPYL